MRQRSPDRPPRGAAGRKIGTAGRRLPRGWLAAGLLATLAVAATAPAAQQVLPSARPDSASPAVNSYGMPGLIDMPSALPMPDGRFVLSGTAFEGTSRATLAFQIAPRITGSFRYSRIDRPRLDDRLYDRSFDLQLLLVEEGARWPALSLGLRDIVGTGEYASEYLVATKSFGPRLRLTGGIGWGRLAGTNSFSNPLRVFGDRFRTRSEDFSGDGGRLEASRWFTGDAALFGGIEYQATDRLRLVAEISGDAYRNETEGAAARWERRTPVNLGFSYALGPRSTVTGYLLHGDTVGITASIAIDPDRPLRAVRVQAPLPVAARPPAPTPTGWPTAWAEDAAAEPALEAALASALASEGLRLIGLDVEARRAVLRFTNLRHEASARALGRAARAMSVVLPPSVEEFVLVPVTRGMPVSAVTLRRGDLEALEFDPDGSEALLARAVITDAAATPGAVAEPGADRPLAVAGPRFGWSLLPYIQPALMDPSSPLRADVGLRAEARYAIAPGLQVSGAITQRLGGNISGTMRAEEACRDDGFCYERVRSEAPLYSSDDPVLERLTVEQFARPGPNLFARVSGGWLERMYAGVAGELLWKPVDSRLALGMDIAHVRRRDPDSFAGLLDYETTTGFVSAYYDFGGGYLGQVDVGRYLAGDVGATLTVSREFASGWRIGAYATLTDMPFSAFGEGSFDKGLVLTIPVTWFDGRPSRAINQQTIRSLTRDGGAQLQLSNRLYPAVRELQRDGLERSWGAVWQ